MHGGRRDIARDIVAAHHVEDHIGAAAFGCIFHGFDEIVAADSRWRDSAPSATQAAHFSGEPAVAKTRAPNALASMMAVVPMPLEPPCTRKVSPGLRLGAVEHIGPHREEGLRHPRRLDETKPGRNRQGIVLGSNTEFRIAAAWHQRANPVADPVALDAQPRAPQPRRRFQDPASRAPPAAADSRPAFAECRAG